MVVKIPVKYPFANIYLTESTCRKQLLICKVVCIKFVQSAW